MTDVLVECKACGGIGWRTDLPGFWMPCSVCAGVGKTWAPDAPSFGCTMQLGERVPGEIVELGNGDVARVLWHSPRPKKKKDRPEVTFVGLIDDFDGNESHQPTRYPSVVGVRVVRDSRPRGDDDHQGTRGGDREDPMQRRGIALF